jgi:hypothetical protein
MADGAPRIALVGSGAHLVRAIESLVTVPEVTLVVVADVSGRSEGAQYAARLRIPAAASAMDVFRTDANLVVETNGDARQYDRLLAIKPSAVEVLSAAGLRLLLGVLGRAGAAGGARPPQGPRVDLIVARERLELYSYLRDALAGVPGIQVVLDRRREDRRTRLRAQATERRVTTRRLRAEVDAALRTRGLAVVRIEPGATPA